jgi:hypothetical protein
MSISNYLCHVVGEQPERVGRLHDSSQRRMKAFAIAIHIPVTLWALTGYVIASRVFNQEPGISAAVALFCAGLIYLVERLVLATPKVWFVNLGRFFIGVVISLLGATAVDLVIFEREVALQLKASGEARITAEFDRQLAEQQQATGQKKADWLKVQDAANCEANGTCGSRVRSVGPVYRELARQATLLRRDYDAAQARLVALGEERTKAIAEWRDSPKALEEAGLLSRVEALHEYTVNNTAALVAWSLFFALVLFFELMVVFAKLVFGETVDDRLARIREDLSDHKAKSYLESVTSPLAGARHLLESSYC